MGLFSSDDIDWEINYLKNENERLTKENLQLRIQLARTREDATQTGFNEDSRVDIDIKAGLSG